MTNHIPYAAVDYFTDQYTPHQLTLSLETCKKTEKKRFRDEIEFLYIVEGTAKIEINQERFEIQSGDLIQLMPYHVHRFLLSEKEEIRFYRIRFSIGLLLMGSVNKERYIDAVKQTGQAVPIFALSDEWQEQLLMFCHLVMQENTVKNPYTETLNLSFVSLLAYTVQKFPSKKITAKEELSSWEILEYIQLYHQSDLTEEKVALHFGVTKSELNNRIHQLTARNFKIILNQVRIRNAAALMQFEELSIRQIRQICGFKNDAHFFQLFEKYYQCRPQVYRQKENQQIRYPHATEAFEILTYIFEHLRAPLTLTEVAEQLHMTPKKVNEQLKQTFSMTFKAILSKFRVRMAAVLLLNTEKSVKEIAHSVGFEDADTFTRNFKKLYHTAPLKWKQGQKKG